MRGNYYFKAKCLSDGHWVTGSYWHRSDGDYILAGECRFSIDPKTVCQFTGMKDRRGNMIFENDILLEHFSNIPLIIKWYTNRFFVNKKGDTTLMHMNLDEKQDEYEVIGNKFDVPEGTFGPKW